jgi:hypothetical protein
MERNMVRSTAISWKIGLVTASALQLWQLPALADDKLVQEVETRSLPLEPKAVPITLLPPASDSVMSSWRPWQMDGATIVMVRPAENVVIAPPIPEQVETGPIAVRPVENAAIARRPEQVETAPVAVRPVENAAIARRPEQVETAPIAVRPAENVSIIQRREQVGTAPIAVRPAENTPIVERPEPVDDVPVIMRPVESAAIARRPEQMDGVPVILRPVESAAIAQPRQQPERIPEDVAPVEAPSSLERRPPVAPRPPVGNAPTASPRPEPVKTQNDAIVAAIPSLPGRSPFRQAPFKSEIVEAGPNAGAFSQQPPEAPKGNAASRFLANLWPGNKGASTPVSSTSGGSPSSGGDGKAGPVASTSAQAQADAGQKSEKPPIKRFLDGIQFWKN